MAVYLLKRLALAVPAVFLSTLLVFMLVRIIPGDPISTLLGQQQDPEVVTALRAHYGLDRPLHTQYARWLRAMISGSLGRSFINGAPVAGLIAERVPRSIYLMLGGLTVSLVIAVPAGIIGATRLRSWVGMGATGFATLLMAVPTFWFGIVLMLIFAVSLGWLPTSGYVDRGQGAGTFLRHMVLPWVTLGSALSALTARILRSSLLDVLNQDYVRTARAKGVPERQVIIRHALRNGAIPTITIVALQIGYLMGGAIVTERVFGYPGMGLLLSGSIASRDYPVIQAGLLFFALCFIVVNLATDVVYALVDPRIRLH